MVREMNEEKRVPALIVVKPGQLREGLGALLAAIPRIRLIGQAGDRSSALRMLDEHNPALVLLETDLPGDRVADLLRHIKAQQPQTVCIVLTGDSREQQQIEEAGADVSVPKGYPAARLLEIIKNYANP